MDILFMQEREPDPALQSGLTADYHRGYFHDTRQCGYGRDEGQRLRHHAHNTSNPEQPHSEPDENPQSPFTSAR